MTRSLLYTTPSVMALMLPGLMFAQSFPVQPHSSQNGEMDITGAAAEPVRYRPPTAGQRWRYLYRTAYSPGALVGYAIGAGLTHAGESVPDWGQGGDGYGRRLGWVALNGAAQITIEAGIAAVLREDVIYYRCACSGFWRRIGHALLSQATSRGPDGSRRLSLARPLGSYGGSLALVPLLPRRFNYEGDGIRNGTWSYAVGYPLNLVREFWPEIKRGVFRVR